MIGVAFGKATKKTAVVTLFFCKSLNGSVQAGTSLTVVISVPFYLGNRWKADFGSTPVAFKNKTKKTVLIRDDFKR